MLKSRRPRSVLGSLAVALSALVSPSSVPAASFHLALRRSDPAKDSILVKAPGAITLWFTQKPEMAVTTISVLDPRAAKVEMTPPRMDAADDTKVIADVKGTLRPGVYIVQWKTSSRDGHVIRGDFAFTVRAPK